MGALRSIDDLTPDECSDIRNTISYATDQLGQIQIEAQLNACRVATVLEICGIDPESEEGKKALSAEPKYGWKEPRDRTEEDVKPSGKKKYTAEDKAPVLDAISGGMSITAAAENFGLPFSTVRSWAKTAGIKILSQGVHSHPAYTDADKAPVLDAISNGATVSDVATAFDVSFTTVRNWAKAAGIELPPRGGRPGEKRTVYTGKQKAEALELHDTQGMSWNAISRKLDIPRSTLTRWAKDAQPKADATRFDVVPEIIDVPEPDDPAPAEQPAADAILGKVENVEEKDGGVSFTITDPSPEMMEMAAKALKWKPFSSDPPESEASERFDMLGLYCIKNALLLLIDSLEGGDPVLVADTLLLIEQRLQQEIDKLEEYL